MADPTTADAAADADVAPEPVLLHGCPLEERLGDPVAFATVATYLPLMKALAADDYILCHDVTAVDYLVHPGRSLPAGIEPERFELVVHVQSLSPTRRLRVRVQVPADHPHVPTLFEIWPGTEAMEREVYDMFGIVFDDHPDPSRILMPEDWEGHPLRKDFEVGRIPVQFKAAPESR